MRVECYQEANYYIIQIEGDLDASSSIQLDDVLEQAFNENQKNILVDFTRLNYISSPGVGVFTSRIEDCLHHNTQLVLFGMSEKIRKVFTILGLDEIITIVKDKEYAKQLSNG